MIYLGDQQVGFNTPLEEGYVSYEVLSDFGVKGDGLTDDTAALSTVFNRSNAVIEGGNKTYKILELTMTECENLVIRNFHFYHGINIKLKHCENIIFQNCIWDEFQDNGIPDKTVHCVTLTTMHTGSAEWTEANNWRMDEVCKHITFDNCQFIGTHFTENTPSLYESGKPHYNTGMALRLEGVDGLRVVGCYFTQNRGNACIQQNCNAPLGDFEITDNFFYLNCWGGIELYRYTGTSSYPTRVIQGNRFIGHGLGYLPWDYLKLFDENKRGVGTAVLLGGNAVRIQNQPVYCAVYNNIFEDNNESAVEGWQWNPVKNNIITGNGVLQTPESVQEMAQKYRITYPLYVRKNPSQNPIYIGQYVDVARYPAGEVRSIENNTIGRMYGTVNPVIFRGYFYEQVIIRNNTITDEALYTDENAKYAHFLNAVFHKGLIWENNVGMKPYFNGCTFSGGEFVLDELKDIYNSTFISQNFESTSKVERFQEIRSARFNEEYATMRNNEVSTVVNGKPVLKFKKNVTVMPTPIWDITEQEGYTSDGYVFGGEENPTILNTGISLGDTDKSWSIYINTTTVGDNDAGNNSYIIKLLSFSDDSGNVSLEMGSRYLNQVWTYITPNKASTPTRLDIDSSKGYLIPGYSSKFILRHKAGTNTIEIFAKRNDRPVSQFSGICCASCSFTSGTAGTLRFGGVPNTDRPKSYYNGIITEAKVFNKVLSDAQISTAIIGNDISGNPILTPVYDIANDSHYVNGTGLVMDGTFGIDTNIPILENTDDFTIVSKFKFDRIIGDDGGGKPNFTFIPVFSAMSAPMPDAVHAGYTDKGFDIGLSMQNGTSLSNIATGGFIIFRRDWRYTGRITIDDHNYNKYQNIFYTIIIRRKDNVITVYDQNLVELGRLTEDYATSIVQGNLTIGARMGYDQTYTDFFKGIISDFRVYDFAVDLGDVEKDFPSIYDNDASQKGAVTYHLSNKSNTLKSIRQAFVEINYNLGEYNSAEYTVQYPKAFGIRLDKIYDDVIWVPCSSAKRVVFSKICKWDAVCGPYESWDIDIVNPGTVPGMEVTVEGVKILLLSKQEAIPDTIDAIDFNISWDGELSTLQSGNSITGYTQYTPIEASSGLTLTAISDNPEVATVVVDGQNITVTGVTEGEAVIHVSIPYGAEHAYGVTITS